MNAVPLLGALSIKSPETTRKLVRIQRMGEA